MVTCRLCSPGDLGVHGQSKGPYSTKPAQWQSCPPPPPTPPPLLPVGCPPTTAANGRRKAVRRQLPSRARHSWHTAPLGQGPPPRWPQGQGLVGQGTRLMCNTAPPVVSPACLMDFGPAIRTYHAICLRPPPTGVLAERRGEGGEGVWDPKVCASKIAQNNVSFCKFHFFPPSNLGPGGGGGVQRGGALPPPPPTVVSRFNTSLPPPPPPPLCFGVRFRLHGTCPAPPSS